MKRNGLLLSWITLIILVLATTTLARCPRQRRNHKVKGNNLKETHLDHSKSSRSHHDHNHAKHNQKIVHDTVHLKSGPLPDHLPTGAIFDGVGGQGMNDFDVCLGWFCGPGQQCHPGKNGLPSCICRSECPESTKSKDMGHNIVKGNGPDFRFYSWSLDEDDVSPVCGTDGIIYPSQCELFRTACLMQNLFLQVNVDPHACNGQNGVESDEERGHSDPQSHYESNVDDKEKDLEHRHDKPIPKPQPQASQEDDVEIHNRDGERRVDMMPDIGLPHPSEPEKGDSDDEEMDEDYSLESDYKDIIPGLENFKSKLSKGKVSEKFKVDKKKIAVTTTTVASSTIFPQETKRDSRGEKIKRGSSLCSPEEYEILKDALLVYNHEHLVLRKGSSVRKDNLEISPQADDDYLNNNGILTTELKIQKGDLLSLMFAHFDHNHDGVLDYGELQKIGFEEQLGRPALHCHPIDFLRFDDINHNSNLSPDEFYTAFNKLYSMGIAKFEAPPLKTIEIVGNVGSRIEIKCPIAESEVTWNRYGVPVPISPSSKIHSRENLLVISSADLIHTGNFSCQHKGTSVIQRFRLTIQSEPNVKVRPHMTLWKRPGESVELECRARGEPLPTVSWLKNEVALSKDEMNDKYSVTGDGITLAIQDINVSDTGAYMCQGQNEAGTKIDISSLVVMDDIESLPSNDANETEFILLHSRGISSYDPSNCRLQHQILATDIIPGTQSDYVCGSSSCEWGHGIKVSSRYVFVSQPNLNRLLVISISQMAVVDVIPTDPHPVKLHYVPHVDQVWVECWSDLSPDSEKTLQVVRSAKEKRKHRAVHIKPLKADGPVQDIFLPPDLPSSAQFPYAYITRKSARGLYKVDLRTSRYVKSVDLSSYNCLPEQIHFSSLYGWLIISCREPVLGRPTGQLVLDILSDAVTGYKSDHSGRSFLSPDSRKLVTLVPENNGATTVILQLVKEKGLESSFQVRSPLNLSDVAFFPSQRFHSYDLYATAIGDDHIFFLDLHSGRMESVPGVGRPSSDLKSWRRPLRPIQGQDFFEKYLVSPSSEAVFVINGRSHTVNCEIGGMSHPSDIIWL